MTGAPPVDESSTLVGYVYLIHNAKTGFYKLGSARRPHVRVKQLCREMRAPCVLLHTIATNHSLRLERETQARFIGGHLGGEWFDLAAVDVEIIQCVSTVWYREAEWFPKVRERVLFDRGSKWAASLPICAAA